MREIILDGRRMDSRSLAFAYLKQALDLPDYFGNNLDALADCLSELAQVRVVLRYSLAMINALGGYGHQLMDVFQEEAASRPDFIFIRKDR